MKINSNVINPPSLAKMAGKKLSNYGKKSQTYPKKSRDLLLPCLYQKESEMALQLDLSLLKSATGVDLIIKELAKIHKKDTLEVAYEAFESFIYYKREASSDINGFITEFSRRYAKAKQHGCELSESTLGFFLLNQAKLSDDHKKLVRATITKLDFQEVQEKLKKIFSSSSADKVADLTVKVEDINVTEDEDVLYGRFSKRGARSVPQRGGYRDNFSRGARSRPYGSGG